MRLIFISLMIFNTCAFAVDVPQSSRFDNRIKYVNYNSGDVVEARTLIGMGLRIVFGFDETILDVGSGFTQGWELLPSHNILYIKAKSIKGKTGNNKQSILLPEAGKWDTNIMVTTDKRMYDLDLFLLSKANKNLSYRIEYKYPLDETVKAKQAIAKNAAQLKLDVKPIPRNWAYSMQIGDNSKSIAPTMAYDDGRFTYLKFPNNRDFPTVFLVAEDKTESIVNSHIDPKNSDILVVQRVSSEMVLRLGNSVIGIYNDNYDPDGISTLSGASVPGVKRILLGESDHE